MNLYGYYEPKEIWIPDPILESMCRGECEDIFLKK